MVASFIASRKSIGQPFKKNRAEIRDGEAGPMLTGNEMQWFVLQSRVGGERAAELHLHTLLIETFLPLARRPINHATRRARSAVRPLFPGYVFARFCATLSLRAVRYSRGVRRILGIGDRPWPMDDAIVASIRDRVGAEGFVELADPVLRSGDSVRVAAGPLRGWSGIFDRSLSDAQRVVILVETLQQGRVVIRRDWLELSDAA